MTPTLPELAAVVERARDAFAPNRPEADAALLDQLAKMLREGHPAIEGKYGAAYSTTDNSLIEASPDYWHRVFVLPLPEEKP